MRGGEEWEKKWDKSFRSLLFHGKNKGKPSKQYVSYISKKPDLSPTSAPAPEEMKPHHINYVNFMQLSLHTFYFISFFMFTSSSTFGKGGLSLVEGRHFDPSRGDEYSRLRQMTTRASLYE